MRNQTTTTVLPQVSVIVSTAAQTTEEPMSRRHSKSGPRRWCLGKHAQFWKLRVKRPV